MAVLATVTIAGWLEYYLLLFLLSTRITALFLAIAFDFLPQYPHQAKAEEQPYQSTSNRVGMEWIMTPLLIFQNYHLVHHLYPKVPFYRLLRVWNAKLDYHLAQNPATTKAFSLTPKVP